MISDVPFYYHNNVVIRVHSKRVPMEKEAEKPTVFLFEPRPMVAERPLTIASRYELLVLFSQWCHIYYSYRIYIQILLTKCRRILKSIYVLLLKQETLDIQFDGMSMQ